MGVVLIFGLIGGLIGGLFFGLRSGIGDVLIDGMIVWLADEIASYMPIYDIVDVLVDHIRAVLGGPIDELNSAETKTRTDPNQTNQQSAKNAMHVGLSFVLIGGLTGGLIAWMIFEVSIGLFDGLIFGLIVGLILGLSFLLSLGLVFGGMAVVQHFSLRFVLHLKGLLPWNLVPFQDYATERIFLRKVGGGYVFVHRMLMDYFASLEPGPVGK